MLVIGTLATKERAIPNPAFSHIPWVHDACAESVAWVRSWLPGELDPWGVRGIFLAGSGAFGEAVGIDLGRDGRVLLSDLDLGVLVAERPPADVGARIQSRLAAPPATSPERPWPELTLGILTDDGRHRQDPTPGLVDLVHASRSLWGDPRTPSRFSAPAPSALPRWEAWRLLGNRSRELLRAPSPRAGDIRDQVRAQHSLAKLAFGCWTACLIEAGRYVPGLAARLGCLDAPQTRECAPASVLELVGAWRGFLMAPALEGRPASDALPSLRRALRDTVARLCGTAAFAPESLADAYLEQPAGVRERLRQWNLQVKSRPGVWLPPAVCQGLQATPLARALGLCTLYWCTVPERPEPVWEAAGPADGSGDPGAEAHAVQSADDARASREWESGAPRLVPSLRQSGPGSRARLLQFLDTLG